MKLKRQVFVAVFFACVLLAQTAQGGSQTPSGVTVQVIIDRARVGLSEVTPAVSFWSDADLLNYTNQAIKEIVYKTKCLETNFETIVLSANTWRYTPTSSFLDIEAVLYDSGNTTSNTQLFSLDRADIKAIGHSKETGPPKVWSFWNDVLVVWPIPRSTEAGTSLYVYLDTAPSGVSGVTNAIETPAYFDDAIVAYVKAQAFLKPGSGQEAFGVLWLKRFDAMIEEYFAKILKRIL